MVFMAGSTLAMKCYDGFGASATASECSKDPLRLQDKCYTIHLSSGSKQRGCYVVGVSQIVGLGNQKLDVGCHQLPSKTGKICICEEELCNATSKVTASLALIASLLIFIMYR